MIHIEMFNLTFPFLPFVVVDSIVAFQPHVILRGSMFVSSHHCRNWVGLRGQPVFCGSKWHRPLILRFVSDEPKDLLSLYQRHPRYKHLLEIRDWQVTEPRGCIQDRRSKRGPTVERLVGRQPAGWSPLNSQEEDQRLWYVMCAEPFYQKVLG
jgi:hypothetical protein